MQATALSPEQIALVVGFALANAGAVFSAFVALKVKLAKIEVHVDILRKDVNALGSMIRNQNQNFSKGEKQ